MSEEDDIWLASLAGRVAEEPKSAEGAALRAALLRRQAEEATPLPDADLAREAALIERARREGLLPAKPKPWVPWLAAAGIAGLAVGLSLQMRPHSPTPVLRGVSGVLHIKAQDPLALKQTLIAELKAAGIDAKGYQNLGRQGVDADLPTPLPAAVRGILQRHGIAPPADGVLQVEIEASP